jgi:hypothetical protein
MSISFDSIIKSSGISPQFRATRYPTNAHLLFGNAYEESDTWWESAIAYVSAHPTEMIVKNTESKSNPLELGLFRSIPVCVLERVLENHANGPHAKVDIFTGALEDGCSYLAVACRYGGDLDLIKYLVTRWPEYLLIRHDSREGGGLITPFTATLFRQNQCDEAIPAFVRESTIAEKKRQNNAKPDVKNISERQAEAACVKDGDITKSTKKRYYQECW